MTDLPSYEQYNNWFGNTPYAVHMGMNQRDLASQFQNQKLLQEQEATKAKSLANMYTEQQNPLQIQQQRQQNELQGYANSDAGVKSRNLAANEALQLSADQKELIKEASKSDLDQMEYEFQRMAYSQDPKIKSMGVAGLQQHKNFLTIREKGDQAVSKVEAQGENSLAVQELRNSGTARVADINGRFRLAAKQAGAKAAKDINDLKLPPHIAAVHMANLSFQARRAGNEAFAQEYDQQSQYYQKLTLGGKPDPQARKIDVGAVTGLPTIPPRQPISTGNGATGSFEPIQKPQPVANTPKIGSVYKGYIYLGGDPSKQQSWKKQ